MSSTGLSRCVPLIIFDRFDFRYAADPIQASRSSFQETPLQPMTNGRTIAKWPNDIIWPRNCLLLCIRQNVQKEKNTYVPEQSYVMNWQFYLQNHYILNPECTKLMHVYQTYDNWWYTHDAYQSIFLWHFFRGSYQSSNLKVSPCINSSFRANFFMSLALTPVAVLFVVTVTISHLWRTGRRVAGVLDTTWFWILLFIKIFNTGYTKILIGWLFTIRMFRLWWRVLLIIWFFTVTSLFIDKATHTYYWQGDDFYDDHFLAKVTIFINKT